MSTTVVLSYAPRQTPFCWVYRPQRGMGALYVTRGTHDSPPGIQTTLAGAEFRFGGQMHGLCAAYMPFATTLV